MKKTIKLLAFLFVIFSINSCEKIEELADVEFDTTITKQLNVHVDQNQESINQTITLNLDNADTHDYLSAIKNVSITKFTYKIIEFTGDENGTITVDFLVNELVLLQESIVVKEADDNQTIFEITDTNQLNTIASALKSNHQISTGISGSSNALNDVMDFKIEITVELAIVANPL